MQLPSRPRRGRAGVAASEIAIVLATLAILAGAMLPRIERGLARARDARRVEIALETCRAIDRYRADLGAFPPARAVASPDGWDSSATPGFLAPLVERGYLTRAPLDPVNDPSFHLRYRVFAGGAEGCAGEGPFYVLGIRAFESGEGAGERASSMRCAGRDLAADLAWAAGPGAATLR